MYLSRQQSKFLAIGTVVVFILGSLFFIKSSRNDSIALAPPPSLSDISSSEEPLSGEQTINNPIEEQEATPSSDSSEQDTPANDAQNNTAPSQSEITLRDFYRSETRDGKTVWEIRGSNAKFFPQDSLVQIQDGLLHFSTDEDKPIRVEGGKALLHLNGSAMKKADIEESVKLTFNDEITINTDAATYFVEEDFVRAPGKVFIESDMVEIRGEHLEANVETQTAQILRNVESVIYPRKKRGKK